MKYLSTQTGNEEDSETLREYAEWRFKKSDFEDFSEWLEKEAKNDPALKNYFIITKNSPQTSISGMTLKEAQEIAAKRVEAERLAVERAEIERLAAEKEVAEKPRMIEEKILNVEDKEDTESTENINEVLRWRFEKSESKDYYEWLENEAKHDPVVKQHLLTTNVLLVTPPQGGETYLTFLVFLFGCAGLAMSFIIGLIFPDLLSIVIIISVIISIIIIVLALGDVSLEHVIISLCYIWFCVFIFYSGANTCIMFCEGQEVLLPFQDG